ncbi:MAG: 4-hydroxy-3-methylbut-2-enyl diphosphate reductase [Planctomycetota bacterium]
MRIVLPNPRGFCAGVAMAIEVVDRAIALYDGEPIFVYHDIVHNRHVVDRFKNRGVRFVEDVDHVPEGAVVVFSAHGIPPFVREQASRRGLRQIDATCPLVTKVHNEAQRYAARGYQILLVGHADHQEIIGTRGEAPDATQVVESPEDIPGLHIDDPEKLVYLTQTTLSTDDAAVIIDALKAAFPAIKGPPGEDICYATTNRQQAVRELAPRCDMVLVVGSRNSSNSNRLAEISENAGTPAHRIDDKSELIDAWFPEGNETVLVTAGASAPEDLVADLCRELLSRHGGTIEIADLTPENQSFNLPIELRREMKERGLDTTNARIRVSPPDVTEALYGAVPLTVGKT